MSNELHRFLTLRKVRELVDRVRERILEGRIDRARPIAEEAFALATSELSPTDKEYVLASSLLACVRFEDGLEEQADELLTAILPHAEAALGPSDDEFLAI